MPSVNKIFSSTARLKGTRNPGPEDPVASAPDRLQQNRVGEQQEGPKPFVQYRAQSCGEATTQQGSPFAAPAQQARGAFENGVSASGPAASGSAPVPAPAPAPVPASQERSASLSYTMPNSVPMMTRYPQGGSYSFTAGCPNQAALLQNYPSNNYGQALWMTSSMAPMGQQPCYSMPYNPQVAGLSPQRGQPLIKRCPNLISILNIFSFLVLVITAPLGIWFSWYLLFASTLLIAGPLAAGLALGAVFFTKWGCCAEGTGKIRLFRFVITLAGIIDLVGAVVIPLVFHWVGCSDEQPAKCEYDKPHGQAFSIAAGVMMGIHGMLCILVRFRAIPLMFPQHGSGVKAGYKTHPVHPLQQSLLHGVGYGGRAASFTNMNMSFTAPVNSYPGYAVQISRPM